MSGRLHLEVACIQVRAGNLNVQVNVYIKSRCKLVSVKSPVCWRVGPMDSISDYRASDCLSYTPIEVDLRRTWETLLGSSPLLDTMGDQLSGPTVAWWISRSSLFTSIRRLLEVSVTPCFDVKSAIPAVCLAGRGSGPSAKLFNKHPLPAVFTVTSHETYHFERRESLEFSIGEWAALQINPAIRHRLLQPWTRMNSRPH